jgi:hypothetical protein
MSYIERERQRGEALQQEQLDWLHQQHEELAAHTRLLAEQTTLLREVRRHTGLVYNILIIWLVLTGFAILFYVVSVLDAAGG